VSLIITTILTMKNKYLNKYIGTYIIITELDRYIVRVIKNPSTSIIFQGDLIIYNIIYYNAAMVRCQPK